MRESRGRSRNSYGRSSNRDYERLRYKVNRFFNFLISYLLIAIVCRCFIAASFCFSKFCVHNYPVILHDDNGFKTDDTFLFLDLQHCGSCVKRYCQCLDHICILVLYVIIMVVPFAGTEIMIKTEIGIIGIDHDLDQMRNIERDLDLVPALLRKGLFADEVF